MGGDFKPMNLFEVGMRVGIEAVLKQVIYPGAAKLSGGEADVMNHEQADIGSLGALVVIWRGKMPDTLEPSLPDSHGASVAGSPSALSMDRRIDSTEGCGCNSQ
jgi:hypothetical protein